MWDRIDPDHGETVPFASPLLHAENGKDAFHDVTLGDTGPYPATPAYDVATGVADVEALIH
jgi:pseudomonalisin